MNQKKHVYTMWLSKNNIIAFLVILVSPCVFGQLVTVTDPVFNTWLCSRVPQAMTGDCSMLDTMKAKTEYASRFKMALSNKGISNADEILFFPFIDTLYLNKNNLTSFPTDLSSFRSLGRLNLASNQLTEAPDIHYKNTIGVDTAVKLVYLQVNQIKTLPDSWYLPNPFTQVIDIDNNELEEIPDFVNYPLIQRLDVIENRLGFEDLVPILAHPSWGVQEFTLFPQKEFEVDIDTLVKVGDKVVVDISSSLLSNEYFVLKDDRTIGDNRTGIFEITINSEADLGDYWFKIKNDNFPAQSEFLSSLKYTIQLEQEIDFLNVQERDVFVFSPDGDGVSDSFYIEGEGSVEILDKNGRRLRMEQLPYEWYGDDENGTKSSPGLHVIKLNNNEFLKVLIAY